MSKEFKVLSPCSHDRDSLAGQGAVRWCPDCNNHVYDFAKMSRREVERLTAVGSVGGIIEPRRGFLR